MFCIVLPKNAKEKAIQLYSKLQENEWRVYNIDNHIGCYSNGSNEWVNSQRRIRSMQC